MATVTFLLKGKNNPCTIYIRYKDGRNTDITVSSNYVIDKNHWSLPKKYLKKPEDHFKLDKDLRSLKERILNARNESISSKIIKDKNWLNSTINSNFDDAIKNNTLIELIEEYRQKLRFKAQNGKIGVSEGTIKNYKTTIERLKKFEIYIKTNLFLENINLDFHNDYIQFAGEHLKLAPNSIGKDIKQIKTVCIDARDRGFEINNQVLSRKFYAPSEKSMFVTLDKRELGILMKFNGPDYLNNARNWLIIGCWTGCRVNDLLNLDKDNLITYNNTELIKYIQQKTGKTIIVPIHEDVKKILHKNNQFPRRISATKLNEYIKELCKQAGINEKVVGVKKNPETKLNEKGNYHKWELVKTHIMRRSFSTNQYNILPNKIIMAVTGHATERMLLNYIGTSDLEHLDNYVKAWQNATN